MTPAALHVRLEAMTASFRHPLVISGTQAVLPVPAYSSLLGMLSACAGRHVSAAETRIGYEYRFGGSDFDFQTTRRWKLDGGRLREHPKGTGVMRRQFHVRPQLDLYVTATGLRSAFESPRAAPCLGRSEDLAWIAFVRPITLTPADRGLLGPTLVGTRSIDAPGLPLTLAEWFPAGPFGRPRAPGSVASFVALPAVPYMPRLRFEVTGNDLFRPSDSQDQQEVVYLHNWTVLPS